MLLKENAHCFLKNGLGNSVQNKCESTRITNYKSGGVLYLQTFVRAIQANVTSDFNDFIRDF